jgi:putative spermidine/putrescine transport system substrate-binding protein
MAKVCWQSRARIFGVVVALWALTLLGVLPSRANASTTDWQLTLKQARGERVNLWMWAGDPQGNRYVDQYLAPAAAKLGVTLHRIAISDTKDALNRALSEKAAGSHKGSVDLVWVNGDNFKTGVQAGVWACNWANHLPNAVYEAPNDPLLLSDFGNLVNGCEAPWHKAQFSLVYNADKVKNPPKSMDELFQWIKANPGRFTYPIADDFTGAAFIRQALYATSGGFRNVPQTYNAARYSQLTPKLWETLRGIKSALWRAGQTYPQSSVEMDKLFSDGQIDFTMTYGPATLTHLVADGTFPERTKILNLSGGTLGNASFLALSKSSANQAGAQVVANLALSPQQQLIKSDPAKWGQFSVLDMKRLSKSDQLLFAKIPTSAVVPPFSVLSKSANPELGAAWIAPLARDWRKYILQSP